MSKETKITKDDIDLIMQLLASIKTNQREWMVKHNNQISDLKKEIKEIHAYLYGGNIVSPMGNGSLRQRIVEGVKNALA
tara:strand:+ start:191 stop:427 length:237 start_codon:yes stop_codon:yes gene_type:complete